LLLLERFIYSKANLILGQSQEIISHVQSIFPEKKAYLYRNFPDHPIAEMNFVTNENQPIKLFYAGLLGVAQGVLELCEKINLENLPIEFHVFGDGSEKSEIENYILQNPQKRIVFHGMLERSELHKKIQEFDIALVPLTTRIYGSVPSKIFEYGSLGFPILYSGGGEGETIVKDNHLGWVVPVGDFENLNATLIEIAKTGKSEIIEKKKQVFNYSKKNFNLNLQMKELIEKEVF
jgi:glycosyltransferase involved in cell wall biosynthesis